MKQLNEEIKRINLMMGLTNKSNSQITESSSIEGEIEEKLGDTIAKELGGIKDLKSIKGTKLGTAFKEMETAIGLYNNPIKLGGRELRTADEIFTVIKDGSLKGKELGRVEKGFLKSRNTPPSLREVIVSEFISNKAVLKDIGKNCKTANEIKTYLKGKGYADESVNRIISQMKTKGLIDNKGVLTINKTTVPPTTSTTSTTKPPVASNIKTKIVQLIRGKKNWKSILGWGLGIAGLSAAAIWWACKDSGEPLPEDFPPQPPVDSEWMPCIQNLINNKKGRVETLDNGQVSVFVVTPEYPKGIQFYSNGRVMNTETGKMGTYKCKGGKTTISEQSSEIDVDTMENYVDTAVDDLDGFVDNGNLNSLLSIVTSLKGKTFQGADALQQFLELYKEDEGGDEFLSDVKSVGVKTLGTKGILAKKQIINLVSGGTGTTPSPTPTEGGSLDNVEITWDGDKTGGGGGDVTPKPKKSIYHDCSKKDFPFEFGCINPKIGEIQKCLGVEPTKGYFGPKTLKALSDDQNDMSVKMITKEIYDKIISNCGGNISSDEESTLRKVDAELPKTSKIDVGSPDMSKLQPKTPGVTIPNQTPEEYYNIVKNAGYLIGETGVDGTNRVKYKGPDLDANSLGKLDSAFTSMGYQRIKQKTEKGYGAKYVWKKI